MDELLTRFWSDLIGRWSGPFAFRFILQPVMAAFYAYRDGRKDAAAGRTPYVELFVAEPSRRRALLRQTWKAVGRVAILGTVMDALYQVIVLRWIYPLQLVVTVFVLAVLPYLLLRGIFTRLLRTAQRRS
jgi:hypothetical protein